jgi:RimJ/RimL family protein N-acetyltransferase
MRCSRIAPARRVALALHERPTVSKPPTRETHQLLLRAPEPADIDALFEIQGNDAAMRFTYCAPDRAATASFIDAHAARFDEDGFAPWTALLRGDGRIVGWGGLNRDPDMPQWGVEVTYFVHADYWGRGLATEIVAASLEHAFGDLSLREVLAFARPANHASVRVLAKAGFSRTRFVADLQRDEFRISSSRWHSLPASSAGGPIARVGGARDGSR